MQYLSSVMDDDIKDYTFIDLGCGKGRALLLAAQMGFRSIIGVGFASELAEVARSNLRTANVSNAFVWEGDAGEFRFPRGKLLIYMYCPFYEPVMSRMIENLRASHQGGNFYVVYMRPLLRQVLTIAIL